jgi:hypothetical protein
MSRSVNGPTALTVTSIRPSRTLETEKGFSSSPGSQSITNCPGRTGVVAAK